MPFCTVPVLINQALCGAETTELCEGSQKHLEPEPRKLPWQRVAH